MKDFFRDPLHILIAIACIVVTIYFGIKTYKELAPKSYKDQQIHCLEMGSDAARAGCLKIIKK